MRHRVASARPVSVPIDAVLSMAGAHQQQTDSRRRNSTFDYPGILTNVRLS